MTMCNPSREYCSVNCISGSVFISIGGNFVHLIYVVLLAISFIVFLILCINPNLIVILKYRE